MKITLNKNPDLDFFVGFFGGEEIPTKQDWYEEMKGYKFILIEKDGTEREMTEYDFYTKKKGNNLLKKFSEAFKTQIKENLGPEHPYKKPEKLEVIISISMNKERLDKVDVDNLSKAIIDCFNGLVFEDDSQIVSLLAFKDVMPGYPINGLMVGVRRLEHKSRWTEGLTLAYLKEMDE